MSFTYKGLRGKLERHIITEEETARHLQRLREQNPRFSEVKDRPTELGDEIILDYAGFCAGEQFAGGTAEKQTLTLGSGMFIPGFEEQLLDKVPGEQVTVHVTFPEQYHSEALAGKEAEFRCTVHAIRVKTEYELDDTFAQEIGGCYTLEEMRQELHRSLQAHSDQQGEMELQDSLLRQAAATLDVTFSEEQLNEAVEEQLNNLKAQLSQQGLSLEMYCSFLNTTEENLRQEARPAAENALRVQTAIDEVVRLENLEVTQEEIGQALAVIARQNRMTVEQLKGFYDAEFEQAVIRSILSGKAAKLIRDAAEIDVM